jgi:hypothetical protein
MAIDERGDAGAVVAAIFQALQGLQQQGGGGFAPYDTDYAAHASCSAAPAGCQGAKVFWFFFSKKNTLPFSC